MGPGIPTRPGSQRNPSNVGAVGSSGSKRKGRQHLPKVGTPKDLEWRRHEHLEEAIHPFSDEPDRRRSSVGAIVAIAVLALVLVGILGLILFT